MPSQPEANKQKGHAMRSLATRFSLLVLAVLATGFAVSMMLMIGVFKSHAGRQAEASITLMIERFTPIAARALDAGDVASLDGAVAAMAAAPMVEAVIVMDAEGRVVAEAGGLSDLGAGLNLTAPLQGAGGRIGRLHIQFDNQGIFAPDFGALLPMLVVLTLFAIGATAACVLFMRRALEPVQTLARLSGQVALQRTPVLADIRTGDEFEILGKAFNAMVTRLDASMRRMQRMAFMDPATHLPNQERFSRDLKAYLAGVEADQIGAVVLLQCDRLANLMETLGEQAGQELLAAVAERLTQSVRATDRAVRPILAAGEASSVARLRGTEFAVLCPRFDKAADAARFAQAIMSGVNQSFDWREHKIALSASCGVSLAPKDGPDAESILRNARLALSAARTRGPGLKFFTKSLDREAMGKLTLEREIRTAIENDEFRAYFQPKIDLRTGAIMGAEALARWIRPDGQQIGPAKFIAAAEEFGLIGKISEIIMREACWKAAAWARDGFAAQVAVNVSPLQLTDEQFPDKILQTLEQAGLPTFCLELEITESFAMEDPERAVRLLQPLRERGVRVAIDDFGCGHSSLAALTRLPFDVIKLDRQFVKDTPGDKHARTMIETMVAMGRSLDLDIVAEGIETEAQAAFLRRVSCTYGQGFLYGAALPPEEFAQMLRDGAAAKATNAA